MKKNSVTAAKTDLSFNLAQLEVLLNGINEAFFLIDPSTFSIIAINKMGKNLVTAQHSKTNSGSLLTMLPNFTVPETTKEVDLRKLLLQVNKSAKKKLTFVQVQNETATYELCIDKVSISRNQHYLICKFRDISERITRKEETLRFVHSIGHELKQPLGLIRAYTYYIKKNLLDMQELLQQYPDKINQQVDVLTSMLNNIVETTKLSTELLTLNSKEVELRELLENVYADICSAYPGRKLSFSIPKLPVKVCGDSIRLRQALLNVLMNAIKYSPENTPISIHLMSKKNTAILTIKDKGIGIPKEQLARIFEPYFRSSHSKSKGVKGLGLGLALVREILRLHKGSIVVESKLNKGSSFIITLPLLKNPGTNTQP